VAEALGGKVDTAFARALEPRIFRFPQDHGAHPDFRTEWWYLTGNLDDPEGDRFGFQFTLFRTALEPGVPRSPSSWATNQVYMAHFALTDGSEGAFRSFERFARGAQGLAGAEAEPFRVWLEDWVLQSLGRVGPDRDLARGIFPLRLQASEGGFGVDLELRSEKPVVLQGDRGLSQKGEKRGNASYYYSFTRLTAEGMLALGDKRVPVRGTAWLDREWSTSVLSEDQVGWDWFALQLSDGRDLMFYQLRRRDGSPDPFSSGVLVDGDGRTTRLQASQVSLDVLDDWISPLDGTRYPSRWRLAIPAEAIELEIVPLTADQELDLTFRYWEGSVSVSGISDNAALTGRGYAELTGYPETSSTLRAGPLNRGQVPPD
jgi:predicted secreted hydrolase